MADEIRVYVLDESGREFYRLYYKDPLNGRKVRKTTKIPTTHDRGKAERAAQSWQDELNAGEYASPTKTTWADFRRRVDLERMANAPPATRKNLKCAFSTLERLMGTPTLLASVNSDCLSRFHAALQSQRPPLSADTIGSYLMRVFSSLRWAAKIGILKTVPRMPKVRRNTKAKGRPLTGEEFERMLAAIPAGLRGFREQEGSRRGTKAPRRPPGFDLSPEIVEPWRFLLEGLWYSGLRLGEAMRLYWTPPANASTALLVDLEGGKRPRLYIPAAGQKNGREQWLPSLPSCSRRSHGPCGVAPSSAPLG